MVVSCYAHVLALMLGLNVVAIPVNYIIFECLAKLVEDVNLILNNFLPRAAINEFIPGVVYLHGFEIRSFKKGMVKFVWLAVNIKA
jgi:hypothetical protein